MKFDIVITDKSTQIRVAEGDGQAPFVSNNADTPREAAGWVVKSLLNRAHKVGERMLAMGLISQDELDTIWEEHEDAAQE